MSTYPRLAALLREWGFELMTCAVCGTQKGVIASRSRACGCDLCPACERVHDHTESQMLRRPYLGVLK